MPIASRLITQFDPAIRQRGLNYFKSGAVRLRKTEPTFVEASVRGTDTYDVTLELSGSTLFCDCTCPYLADRLEPCKHVWATLLAAEAKGGLRDAERARALRVEVSGDDPDDEYAEDLDEPYEDYIEPPPSWASPRYDRPTRTGKSWKQQLASVKQYAQPTAVAPVWPAGRELLYVIDVPASLTRGGLSLETMIREPKKNGELSKPKAASITKAMPELLPDDADRRIMPSLLGADSGAYGYSYYGSYSTGHYVLTGLLLEHLLPMLGATGRVWVRPGTDKKDVRPLAWDAGEPWRFQLDITRTDKPKQFEITGSLRRGEERLPLSKPLLLVPGAAVFEDRLARFDDAGAFAWVRLLRQQPAVRVPYKDREKLLADLVALPELPPLTLPKELQYEEVIGTPKPRIVVKRATGFGYHQRDMVQGTLSFDYDGRIIPAHPPERGVYDPKERRYLRRDLAAERGFAETLGQLGFRLQGHYGKPPTYELKSRNLPRAVRELLHASWHVEAEGKLYRQPGDIHVAVKSGIDWFDLDARIDFDGNTAALPALLAALRKGEDTVLLDDGTFGMLPEAWLKKYGFLAQVGTVEGEKVRFSRAQVGLLDALLAEQPEVAFDQAFAKVRDELRNFEGIDPAEPPAEFQGTLRQYQKEGLGWLHFLDRFGFGGCLADDMGLGKTVQVLAHLAEVYPKDGKERPAPSLVVVPRSLIFNWKAEAARFAPHLRILDHTGLGRGKTADAFGDTDLVLTTYGTLRRDALLFKDVGFDHCILDESQAIKNAATASAKAVRLLKANHRLALSGTPIENHLGELWSLFEFLNPGMLGAASVFQLTSGHRAPDDDTRALLARALRPFILRRTKEQVAPELPAKTEQTMYCDLEPAQRKMYDDLRDHYRHALLARVEREGMAKAKIMVLEALLRLRQAACHPGLIDKKQADSDSAKLDTLLPNLQDVVAEGHKALVFSQFTSFLAIVRKRLDALGVPYEYLDGRTRDREAKVERFQNDPACKLFLISLKAGGVGLNLTAAEYVYLLDPWWNPAVEAQAIDRTHRIGQERPVFAYRLIARDTVEEKVLELQKSKRDLADAILRADNSPLRDLKKEDLEMLLS